MGQPTPPGDMPLFEGLGVEWNDIVGALPEDRRHELAPKIKERLDSSVAAYEPLKQWEDFQKSGITAEQADTALNLFQVIENNPRQVYDTLGKYLGISPQEVKEAVQEYEDSGVDEDPRIATLEQQVNTLAQIALAKNQQETQQREQQAEDERLEKELNALKKKYNDVDEEEVIMRMLNKNLTAEQAYQEYANKVAEIRKSRPAPMLIGGSGNVPRPEIDVRKLDSAGTKNLVAQMLQHANNERNA